MGRYEELVAAIFMLDAASQIIQDFDDYEQGVSDIVTLRNGLNVERLAILQYLAGKKSGAYSVDDLPTGDA